MPPILAPARPRSERKSLGQFFTPPGVADFMAGLFPLGSRRSWRVLDAGAGSGRLTEALVTALLAQKTPPRDIQVVVYEMDPQVLPLLADTLDRCRAACARHGTAFGHELRQENFITHAAAQLEGGLFGGASASFNAAIVNPPYRKINNDSEERRALGSAGIETTNLYTGFLALIGRLLEPGGDLVAITPRSFCNGAYFRPFRRDFLATMGLRRLHLMDSRTAAFAEDAVLQETLIFHAVKGAPKPQTVALSRSAGVPDAGETVAQVPFTDIVRPGDAEAFIHLPDGTHGTDARGAIEALPCTLGDLEISVSTGRVVSFRAAEHLRPLAGAGDAPLLHACHLDGAGGVAWPRVPVKKPNGLAINAATASMLLPAGCFVLVKRLTAKEERKRVVASLFDPARVPCKKVAFENHLNFFHDHGGGLEPDVARGLTAFLNASAVDVWFRQFNGHTQVNATDLRSLRYPSHLQLAQLGRQTGDTLPAQETLDALVWQVLHG